jgi:uncharacterized protein
VDGWLPLDRALRNQLTDVLLAAFADPAKREALGWLAVFCQLATGRKYGVIPVTALLQARTGSGRAALLEAVASLGGMLEWRSAEPAGIAPGPRMVARLASVGGVVRIYLTVLRHAGEREAALTAMEPLSRSVAEAAFCFNAGLFFEAHEHLEHRWVALPPGPVKRFVQGVIQVSVGMYHARRGSYHGAVNQLAKGLDKLRDERGIVMGLDCPQFVHEVATFQQQLAARGSDDMGPLRVEEMPQIRLMGL